MAEVKWNEFRKLHKGEDKKKISELWSQYKEGEYEIPESLLNPEEAPVEKAEEPVAEEPAVEEEPEVDHMKSFALNFNKVFNSPFLSEEEKRAAKKELAVAARATSVKGYVCEPTDGWKLWLGPTKAAVLCNETKDIAFACNRGYWQSFYHGAALCYVETCSEAETVHRMADYFRRRGRFVERVPVPSFEIMLPASKLEIINTASGSWNP